MRFVRHKARKVVVKPTTPGQMASPLNPGRPTSVYENLMSALARAFFWQEMLKLARLTPEIVEDIARGRQPVGLSLLFFVEKPLPDD